MGAAPSPDIVTEIEGWLTAVGTALLGGSTAVALMLGWLQFRKSGFTYSVRVITGRPPTTLLVTIANKGRLDGHVLAVRVLRRPRALTRIKNTILHQTFNPVVQSRAIPQSVGALVETIERPMDLRELTRDLKPGETVTFQVESLAPLPQEAFKAVWLLVRFGDGRIVKKRPKTLPLSITPPP
jgi:hypothetical protein